MKRDLPMKEEAMNRKTIKPIKPCPICGGQAEARNPDEFMRYGKGWFDCTHGHGFYSRGFNEITKH